MSVQKRHDRRGAAGVEHQNADRVSCLAAFGSPIGWRAASCVAIFGQVRLVPVTQT